VTLKACGSVCDLKLPVRVSVTEARSAPARVDRDAGERLAWIMLGRKIELVAGLLEEEDAIALDLGDLGR
jgi:hypothetical protein